MWFRGFVVSRRIEAAVIARAAELAKREGRGSEETHLSTQN
jgi:hypothetical protein